MAHQEGAAAAGPRTVTVDLVVALLIVAFGSLVVWGSHQLGSSWDSNGPQAGYFPFRIGLLICICGAAVFVQSVLRLGKDRAIFVSWDQLKQVMVILIPSALYVGGIQLIGLYVPSALFIGLFMKFVGRYSWLRSALVGAFVAVTAFVLFEIWFKIPLPKGPVERMLGY
jgi:putative tricarboxylic transport membrane protein